jgi:hypothetical protein
MLFFHYIIIKLFPTLDKIVTYGKLYCMTIIKRELNKEKEDT